MGYIDIKKHITIFLVLALLVSSSFSQNKKKTFNEEFYFASASFELDSIETAKAKKYFKLLDKFNLTKIEIYGFADSDGNEKSNLELSQNRITALLNLLKERGYDAEQKVEAKGEENPVYKNSTEEKFKNRRVEVIAYYKNKKASKNKKTKKKVVKEKPILVAAKKEQKIKAEDFKKGKTISLPSVQLEGGTANFLPGAKEILRSVVPLIKEKQGIKIEIAGHICCGNDMTLSIARAKRVYNFLIIYGINKDILTYKGYNNTQPNYGNIMDVRNRRVELKVL